LEKAGTNLKHLALVLVVALASTAYAEEMELRVRTVSHQIDRFGYTISTPETSNANCNVYGNNVNCHSTTYGGGTQQKAVYRMTEVVIGNNMRYTLQRTARWAWQNTDFLNDGETFDAKIKGKSMFITCRRGGNQGKQESIKYEVLDIRPVAPTLPSAESPHPTTSPSVDVSAQGGLPQSPVQQPSQQPTVQKELREPPARWIFDGYTQKVQNGISCQYLSSRANDGRSFAKTFPAPNCPTDIPME
jgi:hypothetical protein